MIVFRGWFFAGLSGLLLTTGCGSPGKRPVAYVAGHSVAFLGLTDASGARVRGETVDSDDIATRLRERTPGVSWFSDPALDRPLREVLAGRAASPDVWIAGVLQTNLPSQVDWTWRTAAKPDRPVFFQVTYPSGLTTALAVDSLIEGFGLQVPTPPAPRVEPTPPGDELRLVPSRDGAPRANTPSIPTGRYFVRGEPEFFENPITGERIQLSAGAVLGLVEFITGDPTGRLVQGEAPAGARLELEVGEARP